MKARLYTRVSHEDQVKYGMSLDAQLNTLRKYCSENNITVVKEYSDEGISGGSIKKRKGFVKLISEISPGEILLFTKLDRFSRNLLDANIIVKELEKKNVSIKAVLEDDIDTTTADGRFLFNLKLSLAEREREKTSERIREVMKYKIMIGESVSGSIPVGYKVVNKKYVKDKKEESMILSLFEYYDKYQSITKTSKWWNATYPDYAVTRDKLKVSKLQNIIYTGRHPSGYNDSFCEPIVSDELFNRVQSKLNQNIKVNPTGRVFLFSGLIRCPNCGNILTGVENRKDYRTYRCNNHYHNNLCDNNHYVLEKKIEKQLIEEFSRIVKDENINVKFTPSPMKEHTKNNKEKISNISSKIERLKNLYIDGYVEREDFDIKYKTLNLELEKLKESESTIGSETLRVIQKFKNINFEDLYNKLNRENKRAFWRRFIKEIRIDNDSFTIVYQ